MGTSTMKFPQVKILVLGPPGVGKSSLIRRQLGDGGYTPENHVQHDSHSAGSPIDGVITKIQHLDGEDIRHMAALALARSGFVL